MLRLAGLLGLAFFVAIWLPRLVPVDTSALNPLIEPDCVLPCAMGIRLNQTSGVETQALLAGHVWVKPRPVMIRPIDDINTYFVYWSWSSQSPVSIDPAQRGRVRVYRDQAVSVTVQTRLTLGEVWLALGAAEHGTVVPASLEPENRVTVIAVYPAQSWLARVTLPRGARRWQLWQAPVEIETVNAQAIAYFSQYRFPWDRLGQAGH